MFPFKQPFFTAYLRGVFKKYNELYVFSKIVYLFMNIYFVPFRVIPMRYCTLVPTFFPIFAALQKLFFYLVLLLFRSRPYLFNRSVVPSFHRPLQFRETRTSHRRPEQGGQKVAHNDCEKSYYRGAKAISCA